MSDEDRSLADRAYDKLRRDLISCRLPPGERLNITLLQNELSLSQAAVREALSRLVSDGLVEAERNRGFRAMPVSLEGFRDLVEACMVVELPCIRAAMEEGDIEWELGLVSTYHRAKRTLELVVEGREDVERYTTERLAFYEALLGACSNNWLMRAWRMLYAQNMRYRHLYMPLARFELEHNALHEAIMAAVLKRDVELVLKLSRDNYEAIMAFIEQSIVDEIKPTARKPRSDQKVSKKSVRS